MPQVDFSQKTSNNQGDAFYLTSPEGETLKINRKDLVWNKVCRTHHYLPDFTDETEMYIALKCARCPHGRLYRKDSKEFITWLDTHRTK